MNELVVFIDDVIKEDSPYGKKLKELIKECQLQLKFINTKQAVTKFLKSPSGTKLVLLDRDLSEIKMEPVSILNSLYKNNIPVIILSRFKATDKRFQEDFRSLDKRLDYLLKDDIDIPKDRTFAKNLIGRAIQDRENKELMAVVQCNLGKLKILWGKTEEVITDNIELPNISKEWASKTEIPPYPNEVIFRLLYEMGKNYATGIRISNIYSPTTTKNLDKKEHENLKSLLIDIKDKRFIPEELKEKIQEIIEIVSKKSDIKFAKVKNIISTLKKILEENPANAVVREAIDSLNSLQAKQCQLPSKFSDAVSSFNEQIREKTQGLMVGNFLQGTRGRGKHLYKANIGKIILEGEEAFPHSWKESIEERLKKIESNMKILNERLGLS